MADAAVVIPFRGDSSVLNCVLQALNRQTIRRNLEIILSIDGLEGPEEEIASLADKVVKGPAGGPAMTRNRGWRSSKAEFILFTDADCVPDARWAERMLAPLRGEYEASKGVYSEGGTKLIQRLAQIEFQERYRIMARRDTVLLADTYSAGFRRSCLERLDGFDETFPLPDHEDVDLSWRLTGSGGRIAFVPDARVRHTHRSTWKSYFRMKMSRGKWRIILVKNFPSMIISDGYTPQMLKFQMLLAPVILASVFLLFLSPLLMAVLMVLFLASCISLISVSIAFDPVTAAAVPVFCFWRALALDAGALLGLTGGR